MRVKELESRLNRRLKQIHKGYAVKNLKRLPNGEHWFDLAMAFNERDMAKVNRVFAELLQGALAYRVGSCRPRGTHSWLSDPVT